MASSELHFADILTLRMLRVIQQVMNYHMFINFSKKIRFDISCKLSPEPSCSKLMMMLVNISLNL